MVHARSIQDFLHGPLGLVNETHYWRDGLTIRSPDGPATFGLHVYWARIAIMEWGRF